MALIAHGLRRERIEAFEKTWASPTGRLGRLRTINNIPIAHRYLATAFLFFLLGGLFAVLMRTQLASPGNEFLDPETYNQLFTMHGTTMMFLFVIPFIEALANYMLPLLLGTRDLPFPRLTALSFWTFAFGGVLIYASFLFGAAPAGGWFAYPPLVSKEFMPGINMDFWDIGLSVAEVAAMGAAAELIISTLRMRAPGMSLSRLPIFAWAMLVTAVMILFAFTPLIVATAMLELDRKFAWNFFDPTAGGEPLLWQHLFWVFGHPEVYIMFIPAVGIVSQVVQVLSGRSLVGYPLVVFAIIATGFISFGLWVHHMFTTGLSQVAMGFFSAASLMIAIPSGIQVFSWIATLWTGRPRWRVPLLFVVGFIVTFVLGGLTGIMLGAVPFDLQVHDSYFVVAHFHYVLIGGVVFPLFAGLYYWLPKMTGRMLSERLGKWNFWLMFASFHVAFFPMHLSGIWGMPRRIYTYDAGLGWDLTNLVSTIGAYGFALGALLLVLNFFWSLRRGATAGENPWHADTLEWAEPSPPPNAQFQSIPIVRSRHPLWEQDSLEPENPEIEARMQPLEGAPTRWRGALVCSVVEGRPVAIVHVPGPTIWPFAMAVSFFFLFAGALIENAIVLGVGGALTLAALIGWFRPSRSERIAIDELGTEPRADRLPLAVAGPLSNGWWGTLVLILILATALASLVASYFYLGEGPVPHWPPVLPELLRPTLATAVIVAAGASTWLAGRTVRTGDVAGRRAGLAITFLLMLTFGWLTATAYGQSGISPQAAAYGSAFVGLLGLEWLVLLLVVGMLIVAQLWAWLDPVDPRGHATTLNAGLVSYFAVASWIVVFITLYLTPRLW